MVSESVQNEELRDFIRSTLAAITDGVATRAGGSSFHLSSPVKFDVAVTATKETEAGGGLRLHVASAAGKLSTQNESVSRIAFEVKADMKIGTGPLNYSDRGTA